MRSRIFVVACGALVSGFACSSTSQEPAGSSAGGASGSTSAGITSGATTNMAASTTSSAMVTTGGSTTTGEATTTSPATTTSTGTTTTGAMTGSGGATSTTTSTSTGTNSTTGVVGPDRPVYDYAASVENTGADCEVAELAAPDELPLIPQFPDPFVRLDETRLSAKSEWRCRRQELHRQAEKYVYGEKPTPELVSGAVSQSEVSVHVQDEGTAIDFSADIVLPATGEAPFPAIINVGVKGGFGGITLGESRILEQGVAVIYYDHYALGEEGTPEQSRGQANPGLFYDIYGGFHSAGLLMAWAWGASRMIDVLQQSGGDIIDTTRLGVTGCSRNGKGAFAIGVFDERIALTIPQETSTAGTPAFRIVDVLNTERTDHNFYGLNWLSNDFEPFVLNASQLPIDTHELVAMIAPRGLLVLDNPHQTQMSAPASHAAVMAGREVFEALGAGANLSYHSDVADTQHCSYKSEYTELLVQNIAKFLKHENDDPGQIVVGQSGMGDVSEWKDWETPTLDDP